MKPTATEATVPDSETIVDEVVKMDTIETDASNDEVHENNYVVGDHNNSFSSDEDSFCERDEDGRRKLPSRNIDSSSVNLDTNTDEPMLPCSSMGVSSADLVCENEQLSITSSSPPSQASSLASSSSIQATKSLRSGASWTKGRGKGGKWMGIRGGLMNKDCLPPIGKAIIDAKKTTS